MSAFCLFVFFFFFFCLCPQLRSIEKKKKINLINAYGSHTAFNLAKLNPTHLRLYKRKKAITYQLLKSTEHVEPKVTAMFLKHTEG